MSASGKCVSRVAYESLLISSTASVPWGSPADYGLDQNVVQSSSVIVPLRGTFPPELGLGNVACHNM